MKKNVAIVVLIIGMIVFAALIYFAGSMAPQTTIKTQEEAAEKIGNISEGVQNIGSTLEDLDQSIG